MCFYVKEECLKGLDVQWDNANWHQESAVLLLDLYKGIRELILLVIGDFTGNFEMIIMHYMDYNGDYAIMYGNYVWRMRTQSFVNACLNGTWVGFLVFLTDLYGVMGDPVTASEYYQLHNSFTKQLLDSKFTNHCYKYKYLIIFQCSLNNTCK